MSTESFEFRHVGLGRVGVALVALGAVSVLQAAELDFHPAMTFGLFHSGNISVVGGARGDDGAMLTFDLALDRNTPTSVLSFSYRPSYVAYRRATDLDYFGNTLVLGFVRDASRGSRLELEAYLSRTDYQGQSSDTADQAKTFVQRTTLTQANVKVGGTVPAGRRGFVDMQLHLGVDRYQDLRDDPSTPAIVDPIDFSDATGLRGRVAWRSELTTRHSLGVGAEIAHFGYEQTPSTSTPGVMVESLGLVGKSDGGRSWLIEYAVGASRAASAGDSINGLSFDAKVDYSAAKATTLGAGIRQAFAPGTGLGAATQDRGAWVSYAHAPTARGISGSVVSGYWQRNSLPFASATATGDTAAFTLHGTIGWSFTRYLALHGSYEFVDQTARDHSDPAQNTKLTTNYSSYGLVFRWAIRGR